MRVDRIVLACVLAATGANSVTAQSVGTCSPALGEAYLDVGNVRARILNNGNLFYRGALNGYNVPKGSPSNALFTSGFWIAGMVDGTLRAAASDYGPYDFWPGPLDETGLPPADCGEYDRIFVISKRDVARYEAGGEAQPDLADWPTGLGAPTVDAVGQEIDVTDRPLAERRNRRIDLAAGERPAFLGDQMAWWVMNDLGGPHGGSRSQPLGIEVHALAFAFDVPGHVGNATFYRYVIVNGGGRTITDAYMGLFADPDMGDFSDDWVGSDTLRNLGYAWNSDNFDGGDEGYGTPPPAIGYDLFQGPIVPSTGHRASVGPSRVADFRNLAMTAFVSFPDDPPSTSEEQYESLRGVGYRGYEICEGGAGWCEDQGVRTPFMYPGEAENCAYWTECNSDGHGVSIDPGDRRFLVAAGPFELVPAASQQIVFGIVYARGENNFDSVRELRVADDALQRFVDSWFTEWPEVPEAPSRPKLAGSPGNGVTGQPLRLTLHWSCPDVAVYCRMQWDDDPGFASPTEVANATTAELLLTPNTRYWWRIRGVGEAEVAGPWSEPWSFTTGEILFGTVIRDFMVVSNAAGPLEPPDCGAFAINDSRFPMTACGRSHPDASRQQSTAMAAWGLHAGGAREPFGPFHDPESFLGVTTRGRGIQKTQAFSDWEIRFTDRGSRAARLFQDRALIDVPFEAWRIGRGTQGDMRLIPAIVDRNAQGVFDIGGDHAISRGANDPATDWMTFYLPDADGDGVDDLEPGEAGYEAWLAGTGGLGSEVWANLVLVCFDCGSAPPYPMPYPEVGTTFRIATREPDVPILAAPAGGGDVEAGDLTFHWSAQDDYGVGIQVASDPGFATVVYSARPATTGLTVPLTQPGRYWWRLGGDEFGWSLTWALNVIGGTAAEAGTELPTEFALDGVWPNPFNPVATVRFGLPAETDVTIDVVDVLGRRVAVIDAGVRRAAGWHTVPFDGSGLASGVYFVRLAAAGRLDAKSVVLLR